MSCIDSFITYDLTKKQYYLLHLQSYMYRCTSHYLKTLVPSTGSWGTSMNSNRL